MEVGVLKLVLQMAELLEHDFRHSRRSYDRHLQVNLVAARVKYDFELCVRCLAE